MLPVPFVAQTKDCFVIINSITRNAEGKPAKVNYLSFHRPHTVSWADFEPTLTGIVLTAQPSVASTEPDYSSHRWTDFINVGKKWVLGLLVAFLGVFGLIYSGIGHHLSLILLLCTDMAGLAVAYMLILKTLRVHSHTADKVCGILVEHGCDTVLEDKSSTFFGIFSWSEVGLAYFSVSTLILFLFPNLVPWLALLNGCCLPFTIWSISYQKFKLKTWCTLCVTTQGLLWLQFFCFFFGGWWSRGVFPLGINLFLMIAAYGAALLGINHVDNFIKSRSK